MYAAKLLAGCSSFAADVEFTAVFSLFFRAMLQIYRNINFLFESPMYSVSVCQQCL